MFATFRRLERYLGLSIGNIAMVNVIYLLYAIYTSIFLALVNHMQSWSNTTIGKRLYPGMKRNSFEDTRAPVDRPRLMNCPSHFQAWPWPST